MWQKIAFMVLLSTVAFGGEKLELALDYGAVLEVDLLSESEKGTVNFAEPGGLTHVTMESHIAFLVRGPSIYLDADAVLSRGDIRVVHPAHEKGEVLAVSIFDFMAFFYSDIVYSQTQEAEAYFEFDSFNSYRFDPKEVQARSVDPLHCSGAHNGEAPHRTDSGQGCHGEKGSQGECGDKNAYVQYLVTCASWSNHKNETQTACFVTATCEDGNGLTNSGVMDNRVACNLWSSPGSVYAGFDGQTGMVKCGDAELSIDCSK